MSLLLPTEFSDLEIFASDWALPTQEARLSKRLSSSMEEIKIFYTAMVPRIEAILAYLDKYPIGDLPKSASKLMDLAYSLAMVAPAVEMFKQPAVVCGFDARKFLPTHEPTSTRPSMSVARKALV
jgi:hypothetical protein